ncbi:cell division protein FtsL [Salimicrobium halophilum]|uniref:Cell division protein FtsL n=1 Tax=Salimicrobium halophilum TaxID=86666 RepID=A0A1G8QGB6_9BACI|nr:cell division protein FtsL [Salimicrobium halophilum]SDJ03688.1 cell division protein FtsL [Salimicrobium halophilum]
MSTEKVRAYQPETKPKRKQKQVKVKVTKKKWISTGEKYLYSVISGAMLCACAYVISFSSATDSLNRDIESMEGKIQEQQSVNNSLSYEAEQLRNPERILEIAKKHGLDIKQSQVKQAGTVSAD